jgi:pyruvate,water dikinase
LEKFGDRCLDELKLESPTLHDDPLLLLRSVGRVALQPKAIDTDTESAEVAVRRRAENAVGQALARSPLKHLVFRWVLKHARARIRDRENLRFERTRLFGRVRRIFIELGRRFNALDLLESPRDIFYLELNEITGFVDGTTSTTRIKDLVALRTAEFESHRHAQAPADRFETHGTVHQGHRFEPAAGSEDLLAADALKGIGCCPGVIRGPVRVVTDPRNATLQSGEILVAERTDPGWVMLFPCAMGIPAVVSVSGVTRWLKDGDWVELNGSSGTVRRINAPEVARDAE